MMTAPRYVATLGSLFLIAILSACGGPGVEPENRASSQPVPSSAELSPGDSLAFQMPGTAPGGRTVDWTVLEPGGGSIDASGNYTAPAAEGTFHIEAKLDGVTVATAEVRVKRRAAGSVAVSPSAASVEARQSLSLTASEPVTWSLREGSVGGTITPQGVYTAPAAPGTYHVDARPLSKSTKSGSSTITVTEAAVIAPPAPAPTETDTPPPSPTPTETATPPPPSPSPNPPAIPAPTNFALTVNATQETTGTVYSIAPASLPAGTAKVQFLLDDHDLYDSGERVAALPSPYTISRWHSRNVLDGPHWFGACAQDAAGVTLGCAADAPFTVANGPTRNPDGQTARGSVTVTASASLDAPLSGTVSVTPASSGYSGTIVFTCTVDGIPLDGRNFRHYGPTSWSMDTTRWPNGTHLLYCWAAPEAMEYVRFGSYTKRLTFANGQAAMALTGGYSEVHLNRGETVALSPAMLYTDGTSTAVSPSSASYSSTNTAIAGVGASGLVTAGSTPGVARISVTYAGKTATVYAFTHADKTKFKHFGKDGTIRDSYDPASSMLLRTMFQASQDYKFTPAYGYADCPSDGTCMSRKFQAAGLNAFTTGAYYTTGSCGGKTFEQLKSYFDTRMSQDGSILQFLSKYNPGDLYVFYTFDDLFALGTNKQDAINQNGSCPDGPRFVQYMLSALKSQGRAVGFSTFDEISGAYGNTPFPAVGSNTWTQYGIPDTFFKSLFDVFDGATVANPGYTRAARPPLANPLLALTPQSGKMNWQGANPTADFNEAYWTYTEVADPVGQNQSFPHFMDVLDQTMRVGLDGQLVLNAYKFDAPTLLECNAMGPNYMKLTSGADHFVVETDAYRNQAFSRSEVLGLCAWYVAARGGAGIMNYAFEFREKTAERKNWCVYPSCSWGAAEIQTNTNWKVGADRWASMSASYSLLGRLEPYLLQPQTHAPNLGPYVITGARKGQGGVGNSLVVINSNHSPRTLTVPLAAYSSGKANGTRYRVVNTTVGSATIGAVATDTLTLAPSETAVYVFW